MNRFNTLFALFFCAGIFLPGSNAQADSHEISGNIALTSQYVWRGLQQSREIPAVQGGFDWSHQSGNWGFGVGTWGSSIGFGKGAELDMYGGPTYKFSDNFNLGLSFLYYSYFDPSLNFYEIPLSIGIHFVTLGYAYDPDNKNGYASLGATHEICWGISGAIGAGYSHFDSGTNYADFKVGVSKDIFAVTLDVSGTFVTRNVDDEYIVVSLSKSL